MFWLFFVGSLTFKPLLEGEAAVFQREEEITKAVLLLDKQTASCGPSGGSMLRHDLHPF
jgi:hypothetical protein